MYSTRINKAQSVLLVAVALCVLVSMAMIIAAENVEHVDIADVDARTYEQRLRTMEIDSEYRIIDDLVLRLDAAIKSETENQAIQWVENVDSILHGEEMGVVRSADPVRFEQIKAQLTAAEQAHELSKGKLEMMKKTLADIKKYVDQQKEERLSPGSRAAPGLSVRQPATSCWSVMRASRGHRTAPDGLYWFNVGQADLKDTFQMYCDMTGGAYGLIAKMGEKTNHTEITMDSDLNEIELVAYGKDSIYTRDATEVAHFNLNRFDAMDNKWILKVSNHKQVLYASPQAEDDRCTLKLSVQGLCARPLRYHLGPDHKHADYIESWEIGTNYPLFGLEGQLSIYLTAPRV